jgi:hypothetical protein
MKTALLTSTLLAALAANALAQTSGAPQAYINENLGFNVEGYKYSQTQFPCDIDKHLVANIIEQGKKRGLRLEAAGTADKIRNGVIPVIAMDVEQLVLGDREFGTRSRTNLPKVQVTAAVIKGDELVTAKHTCAIATLNRLTPSTDVMDMGTAATVCSATRKCLKDLGKDIVQWVAPQLE